MKNSSKTDKMRELITADMVDFAEKCAHKFQSSYPLPIEDLKEAAYLGLCKAALNYQEEKGGSFKALVFKHIWKQVQKQNKQLENSKLQTISLDKILDWKEGQEHQEENEEYFQGNSLPVDLEDILAEEDDNFRKFEEENLSKISIYLMILTPREKEIITSYFGLKSPALSFQEIGKNMQMSKGRIHQIYEKALQKIKNYALNHNENEKH